MGLLTGCPMVSEGRGFLCALGDSGEFPASTPLGFDFTCSPMNKGCCACVCMCMCACMCVSMCMYMRARDEETRMV